MRMALANERSRIPYDRNITFTTSKVFSTFNAKIPSFDRSMKRYMEKIAHTSLSKIYTD